MPTAIAYYRVSTQRQGRSGLGIKAQRAAVARFAEAEGMIILQEFTEIETGKGADSRNGISSAPYEAMKDIRLAGALVSNIGGAMPMNSNGAS